MTNDKSMLPIGTVLNGRYIIRGHLSSGGFGKTYLAVCRPQNMNPAKRNVLDLKNETCKNREKRNVLKISHTRYFKAIKKQSVLGCFYSF